MFDGELESLNYISKTNTVRVPKPIKVITHGSTSCIIMEHLDLRPMSASQQARLGEELARFESL